MKRPISLIKTHISEIAGTFISRDEAKYFAQLQVENHLKKFPQNDSLLEGLKDLQNWSERKDREIKIVLDKQATLALDFKGLAPSIKIKYIHDELEARAKKNGISMVVVKNSGGFHELNLWTDKLAERNLLSICMFNGGSFCVVPYGGNRGLMGTNPISYSFPAEKLPVIADFATSEVPYREVREAIKRGKLLPERAAVDTEGKPTRDPKKVMDDEGCTKILPMGGSVKGYLVNYLIEVMTSALFGAPICVEKADEDPVEDRVGVIMAFDIANFTETWKFKKSVAELNHDIRKQSPARGLDKVRVPGDMSNARYENAMLSGEMGVSEEAWVLVNKLSK